MLLTLIELKAIIILLADKIREGGSDINQIKKLRIEKEMTQLQLAKACGVSQGAIAMWEKGICFPKSGRIMTVARVLGCESDLLLQMAEEKRKEA